jgi:hypothetical protein
MPNHERTTTLRVDHNAGGYSFTPSDLLFASGGVVALPGMAIEHAAFPVAVPLEEGFELVQRHLESIERPLTALCGFELHSPEALPWGQFDEFNERYFKRLAAWELLSGDGTSPLARTNVAPLVDAPIEPSLLAFSYTNVAPDAGVTFIVSGVAELMEPYRMPDDVVRAGETSAEALLDKARSVVGEVGGRLKALGVVWDDSVAVHLYSGHDLAHAVKRGPLTAAGVNPAHGVVWHDAAPPVVGLELEIDVRRYHRELIVWPSAFRA